MDSEPHRCGNGTLSVKTGKAVVGRFHLIDTPYPDTMGVNPDEVHFIARNLFSIGCHRLIIGYCIRRKANLIRIPKLMAEWRHSIPVILQKYEIWKAYQSENQGYTNLESAFARETAARVLASLSLISSMISISKGCEISRKRLKSLISIRSACPPGLLSGCWEL